MKLVHTAVVIGIAAWAVAHAVRAIERERREKHKEAVTRWEGEGGAIPDVEGEQRAAPYRSVAVS
jgi:hypothetical protein